MVRTLERLGLALLLSMTCVSARADDGTVSKPVNFVFFCFIKEDEITLVVGRNLGKFSFCLSKLTLITSVFQALAKPFPAKPQAATVSPQ